MPRLTLLLGGAGSGKTQRVLTAVALEARTGGLPNTDHPPLLVLVPEQQAVTTERALLTRLGEFSDVLEPATARIRVMSFNRLAQMLAASAGAQISPLGELGRQLLVWRLLPAALDRAERQARAAALSDIIAELTLYGTAAEDLRARAAGLPQQPAGAPAPLAGKLEELADLLEAYQARSAELGLDYAPAAALIPQLLTEDSWPLLGDTLVWIDGFAGFTPVEERALGALLRNCAHITATLLIDPTRLKQPADDDWADWYEPTRRTYRRWQVLAAAAGAALEEIDVSRSHDTGTNLAAGAVRPHWKAGSPLAQLALSGLQPGGGMPAAAGGSLRAVVCTDERAEVDAAARRILDLTAQGLRFSEISVVCRSLEVYADLIAARFPEHGIPAFIDARRPLAGHPAGALLLTGLRLLLGQAGADDPPALLRTGLLLSPAVFDLDPADRDDCIDQLVKYSRAHGLFPSDWLMDDNWHWRVPAAVRDDVLDADLHSAQQESLSQLDQWRREFMAPLIDARRRIEQAGDTPSIKEVLAACWECLCQPAAANELERWAALCEQSRPPQPDRAALHRAALGRLAALWDELVLLAGDLPLGVAGISAAELCAWVESGISALTAGQPPPRLNSVLVTEIERGRHHPVRASLLLGLADGSWPPLAAESAYLSDVERRLLNEAGPEPVPLIGDGAAERVRREPYLALVAATRASDFLHISRPGADSQGALRPPSPYFSSILAATGVCEEPIAAASRFADPGLVGTPGDLAVCAALRGGPEYVGELLAPFGQATAAAWQAVQWSHFRRRREELFAPLSTAALVPILGAPDSAGSWRLRCSPSRLEMFAACPFKHYVSYYLRLEDEKEDLFDSRLLGGFYHRILQRAIEALSGAGPAAGQDLPSIRQALRAAVDECLDELAEDTNRQRLPYLAERADALLWHLANVFYEQFTVQQRAPWGTEIRLNAARAPHLRCEVADGNLRVELSGFIDRLDLATGGGATVVDYKLGGSNVSWDQFLSGQQIQLFTYMLAVAQSASEFGAESIHPEAIEFQPVEPSWASGGEADFKPRRVPPASAKDKLADLLPNALSQTRRIILELADRITSGEIVALPLLTANGPARTACVRCEYRSVCRFDPLAGEPYRLAPVESSAQLRDAIAAGEDFAGSARAIAPEVAR